MFGQLLIINCLLLDARAQTASYAQEEEFVREGIVMVCGTAVEAFCDFQYRSDKTRLFANFGILIQEKV